MTEAEQARVTKLLRALPVLLAEVQALAVAPLTAATLKRYVHFCKIWQGARYVLKDYEDSIARWN